MFSRSSLLITIAFSTMLIQNCHAMERETNKIIPFNDGLTTKIPGIMSETYYDLYEQRRYIRNTSEKTDSFLKLIVPTKNNNGYTTVELFCPIVFRESAGFIENLGRLDKNKHREALHAVCQKKALYYASEQGAVIYTLNAQPDPTICKQLIEPLKNAKKQPIK